MKFIINMLIMIGLATMIANAASKDDLKDQKKRFGYGLGANYARNLKQNNLDVDLDRFLQGMKDYLSGESLMQRILAISPKIWNMRFGPRAVVLCFSSEK